MQGLGRGGGFFERDDTAVDRSEEGPRPCRSRLGIAEEHIRSNQQDDII